MIVKPENMDFSNKNIIMITSPTELVAIPFASAKVANASIKARESNVSASLALILMDAKKSL